MTTPFAGIYDRFVRVRDSIGIERAKIIELNQKNRLATGNADGQVLFQQELRDLKEEEKKYNQDFREQQAILQSKGGKSREQTLQEFVLLFFYIAFGLLAISLAVYVGITSEDGTTPWGQIIKIIGLMVFIGMLVTGIIIRYA